MVRINNSDTIKAAIDAGRLSTINGVPTEMDLKVIPVIEVNPHLLKIANIVRNISIVASSSNNTLYSTETNKETYITSAFISLIKDATHDGATGRCAITTTIDGASREIISVGTITLTAQNIFATVTFTRPVKVDKNSTIAVTFVTNTVGLVSRTAGLTGYTIDYQA